MKMYLNNTKNHRKIKHETFLLGKNKRCYVSFPKLYDSVFTSQRPSTLIAEVT